MRWFAIPLLVALQAGVISAAATQRWELSTYGEFLAGTFKNIALDREGVVRVAPSLDVLHDSEQAVVWSLARAEDGSVYYGTGHQGAVFRVAPDGSGKLLWNAPEIEVFALAVGADSVLYAGTSPRGKVYKVTSDGDASEFFDPGEEYIWSLAFDEQGRLLVGTGGSGKIYRVMPDGTGTVWFESGQRHVMSLALDAAGNVLVGTDPDGILYRVSPAGAAFALHDADLPEVRAIAVGGDGAIFFAAMGGGMDRMLQAIPVQQAPVPGGVTIAQAGAPVSTARVSSAVSYSQPQVVYAGERAALMRIVDGQAVEKLWTSNEEQLLGMSLAAANDAGVLFATDRGGRIYRTGVDRQLSLISQTGKSQMTVLLAGGDGLLAGSAHGGALYRLNSVPAERGVYETAPRDTGGVSTWGQLSWRASVPEGASIEIRTRSGNMHRAGPGWSPWSEPLSDSDGSAVSSPPARFLQWQATLRGAAALSSVRVHYLPQNSPPVVRSVNVVPETAKSDASSDSQSADTTSSYSITVSASGESTPPTPTSRQSNAGSVRKLAIVWSAQDPDGDKLRAEVSFRGEGETVWKTIRKDLAGPKFSIDSDALADGRYEFRVRVDDGLVNPAERALSADRISRPVLVDQTPPSVTALAAGAGGEPRFRASDAVSAIRAAEYSVDAGDWRPVLSEDGLLDARDETFTLRLGDLEPGEHLVVLRVRDAAGNTALGKSLLR